MYYIYALCSVEYVKTVMVFDYCNDHLRGAGTKADLECSGAGICDETSGICNCMMGFISSNGSLTQPGER